MPSTSSLQHQKKRRSVAWVESTVLQQLQRVEKFLGLAAFQADQDPEHVHQLRVATRRAMAAIDLCQDLFGSREVARLQRLLRNIRQAAGEARDVDVFLENHPPRRRKDARHLNEVVAKVRERVQEPIRKIASQEDQQHKLRKAARDLFRSLNSKKVPQRKKAFLPWLKKQVRKKIRKLIAAEPKKLTNLSQLHQFRIRCKELRYTLETLQPFASRRRHQATLERLEDLQDRLGELNDQSVACDRIRQWSKVCEKSDSKVLSAQLKTERQRLNQAVKELSRDWSMRPIKRLEKCLRDYLRQFPAKRGKAFRQITGRG